MNQPNFAHLLNKPANSFERPKAVPMGTYLVQFIKFEFGESANKKTPFVRFLCSIVQPGTDVDKAALPEGWQEREFRYEFYLTPDAMFRLREFLGGALKMPETLNFDVLIPQVVGKQAWATIIQQPSTKPGASKDDIYNNITGFAAVQ